MRKRIVRGVVSLGMALAGCEPVGSMPELVSTSPAAGAQGVEPYAQVRAVFADDLEPAAVDETTFVLTHDGQAVAGRVSYASGSRTASFVAAHPLAAGLHQAAIRASTDDGGGPEAAAPTWSFVVRERGWDPAVHRVATAQSPRVAFDAAGHAIAVFSGVAAAGFDVADNRWEGPEMIAPSPAAVVAAPELAGDLAGGAVAVWAPAAPVDGPIVVDRFRAGVGWSGAVAIGDGVDPRVVADAAGGAVVVWRRPAAPTAGRHDLWAIRYQPGQGWGAAERIESEDAGTVSRPQLAIDRRGNVIAVWDQHDGVASDVWANRYVAGRGWGTAVRIKGGPVGDAKDPDVAIDQDGGAVAVWRQANGVRWTVVASRFAVGKGWTAGAVIGASPYRASRPRVAVAPTGRALVAWTREDLSVWAAGFTPGQGWASPVLLGREGMPGRVELGVDATGTGFAVWDEQFADASIIVARRFLPGLGWQPAERLHAVGLCLQPATSAERRMACRGFPAAPPELAVHPDGSAVVVWQQADGLAATSFR